MNEILEFLNKNTGALTVLFTGMVTIATVAYAVLTWSLVRETKLMREAQTEPKLEVRLTSFEFALNIVKVHFRNVGSGPAIGVRITPSVVSGGESAQKLLAEFADVGFFKTGISYFGAGQERVSGYTQLVEDHAGKMESVIKFTVEYSSATGKKYSEDAIVDMSEFKGTYQLGRPSLYSIAKSMEKIEHDIHGFYTGFKKLKIDLYTTSDREREQNEHEEFIERAKKLSRDA